MKIAFTTFACPDWTLEQAISAAVDTGYDGIEFRCEAGHKHGVEVYSSPDERRKIRSKLESAEVVPCCLGTSLQFIQETVAEQASQRIQLAADIGCPGLRVFCGLPPKGTQVSQILGQIGQRLDQAAHFADEAGVELWLETHDAASHAATAAAIVARTSHRAVGIAYDNLHPYRRGESLEATVAALGGMTRHVHLHDGLCDPDKVIICPFGKGELPIEEMFAALVKMGFDGYISGEWFYDMYGDDPLEALARYHAEITSLAREHGINIGRLR